MIYACFVIRLSCRVCAQIRDSPCVVRWKETGASMDIAVYTLKVRVYKYNDITMG